MEINVKIKDNVQIRAFYLFFIVTSIQIGVGVMGAPMYIFREAHQDSWVSILIAIVYIFMVLFVMLTILKQYKNADIFGIQVDVFGKWIGKTLGTVYILYIAAELLSVLNTYIQVIQIFIFPELSSLVLAILLMALVVYSVHGGIKVVVGVAFLFFFLSHWLLFLLYGPALRMDLNHFQPVFHASISELLQGAKSTSYTFMGFEILFLIYPFIQNKKQASFPVYFGAFWSGMIILIVTIISIGYYSPHQIIKMEWAVLSLFKVVNLPFVERFDYIVVAEWMMVVMPNMVLLIWGVTYGMKRLYNVRQKTSLWITAVIIIIFCGLVSSHNLVIRLTDMIAKNGFWLVYVYPFLLLPLVLLKKKLSKKKGSEKQ